MIQLSRHHSISAGVIAAKIVLNPSCDGMPFLRSTILLNAEVLSDGDAASAYPDALYSSTTPKFAGAAGRPRRFWYAGWTRRLRQQFAAVATPIVYDLGCGDPGFWHRA